MISSIVLTDCHKVSVSSNKKIKIGETILSIEKEIPFVRYRFQQYTEREYNYIKEMMQKFEYSTHLMEVTLNSDIASIIKYAEENIEQIAKYVYIPLTDEDVARGSLSDEVKDLIDSIADFTIDRYMLKDNTSSLDAVSAKKIIKNASTELDIQQDEFGVCSSPLSFGELACLTAVKARELMSIYSKIADVALPSANHQCMNCCGCIRYIVIDKDTDVIQSEKKESGAKKSNGATKQSSRALTLTKII